MTRNPYKTSQIGRSYLSGGKHQVEPPRVKMECQRCKTEVIVLFPITQVTGEAIWLCDTCRKGAK